MKNGENGRYMEKNEVYLPELPHEIYVLTDLERMIKNDRS
jgi:hypothetical protein